MCISKEEGDIDAGSTFPRKKGRKVVAAKRSGKVQGSSNQRSADLLQGLSELLDLVPQMESSAEQLACMVGTHFFFSSYERNSTHIAVACLVNIIFSYGKNSSPFALTWLEFFFLRKELLAYFGLKLIFFFL